MLDLRAALKTPAAKKILYVSGALDAWHRRRNRDRLTVIMFHRVLSPRDPRWAVSDPEYTISDEVFGRTLDFFARHYAVVSLDDVLSARAGRGCLPERALLVSFDDGWSDVEEYALPHLQRTRIPSVLFVAGAALGRAEAFWQEQLVHAWRAGQLDAARTRALWSEAGEGDPPPPPSREDLGGVRAVISRLEQLDPGRRERILAGLGDAVADTARYMVTSQQLRSLSAGGVAIGAHGFSHEPLTRVDVAAELARAREAIASHVPLAPVVSFPHGRFDAATVDRAHAAGFALLFTSVPELPSASGRGPGVLGRIGFTEETVTEEGAFAPEKLALHLFRKPHART